MGAGPSCPVNRRNSPYLLCRYGTHFVRVRVPRGLVERVGVVEVRRSLGSSSLSKSRLLALRYGAQLKRCFEMLLLTDADAFACQKAIQRIYTELATEVLDIRPPRGDDAWLYREEQEQLSKEAEQALEDQIEQGQFSPALERTASELLARHSVIRSAVLPEQWDELVSAVARAMAEAHRRYRYQLSGSIFPFVPTDTLFASQPPETTLGIQSEWLVGGPLEGAQTGSSGRAVGQRGMAIK